MLCDRRVEDIAFVASGVGCVLLDRKGYFDLCCSLKVKLLEVVAIVYCRWCTADLGAGRGFRFGGFGQLLAQVAFAIAVHRRFVLVLAKVGGDPGFVELIMQADGRYGEGLQQHEQQKI